MRSRRDLRRPPSIPKESVSAVSWQLRARCSTGLGFQIASSTEAQAHFRTSFVARRASTRTRESSLET